MIEMEGTEVAEPLWAGDVGELPMDERRALLAVLQRPYLDSTAREWAVLLRARDAIASRLNDLFLDLVIDEDAGVAFLRNVVVEGMELPKPIAQRRLSLAGTVLVLFLRNEFIGKGAGAVFVSKPEVLDALEPYALAADLDVAKFKKAVESAWNMLEGLNVLVPSGVEGRFQISPVLRVRFGPDECRAVERAFVEARAELLAERGEEAVDPAKIFIHSDEGGVGLNLDGSDDGEEDE